MFTLALLFTLLLPALLTGFETHDATTYGELRGLIHHAGSSRMGLGDNVVLSQTNFTLEPSNDIEVRDLYGTVSCVEDSNPNPSCKFVDWSMLIYGTGGSIFTLRSINFHRSGLFLEGNDRSSKVNLEFCLFTSCNWEKSQRLSGMVELA